MDESERDKILGSNDRVRHTDGHTVEFVVYGNEVRQELAERLSKHCQEISGQGTKLLQAFMRDKGTFDLDSVEVFECKDNDGADFSLSYKFTADHDPNEYNYTYFEVFFAHHEPPQRPYSPVKFTVGFH
jgi:hypothetical protein